MIQSLIVTCSKCAREVPPGQAWCEVCKAPTEFSVRERHQLNVDVRARVLWAEPIEVIRDDWLKKGAPAGNVEAAIEDALRARHRHFRFRGLVDLGLGILAFLLGGGACWIQYLIHHGQLVVHGDTDAILLIAAVALPCAGLGLSFRGIRRLMTGGASEGAASDLSEFE